MTQSRADAAMSTIHGQRDAQRLVFVLREGCPPADALLEAFRQVQAINDPDRLQGFARELQKTLERAAA